MRTTCFTLAALACVVLVGCQQVENILNPPPTTEGGSRTTAKLRSLPPPAPGKVKVVTVYRFQNKTGFPHGLAITNGMTDQLITALVKSGHFRVVERANLGDVMTEKRLQKSGEATGKAAGKKLTGADLIIMGAVTELSDKVSGGVGLRHWGGRLDVRLHEAEVALDMRVVDAATGEVIDSLDVRKKLRKTGVAAGHKWGIRGDIQISNALDLAIRETLEEAVYQLVTKHGAI